MTQENLRVPSDDELRDRARQKINKNTLESYAEKVGARLATEHRLHQPSENQVGGDHYGGMAIDPATYVMENDIPWCEGEIIKYVSRWRLKDGVQDLKKAQHLLGVLIERAL